MTWHDTFLLTLAWNHAQGHQLTFVVNGGSVRCPGYGGYGVRRAANDEGMVA